MTRTRAFRRTTPLVTMQPAIVPRRETRKSARTSASPSVSSVVTAREHADERLLDVLRQLVDDAVGADLDALALGERRASAFGRTLKPTTSAFEAEASMMSLSVIAAHAAGG